MKLGTFTIDYQLRLGVITPDQSALVDIQRLHQLHSGQSDSRLDSMLSLAASGPAGLDLVCSLMEGDSYAECAISLPDIKLAAPLPESRQLRDFSVFERHLRDGGPALRRLSTQS